MNGEKLQVKLSKATIHDLDMIYRILQDGRQQLSNLSINQWQDDYPSVRQIVADIEAGYTLLYRNEHGEVIGTAAVLPAPDRVYNQIQGTWLMDTQDYVTIHRVAIHSKHAGQGHGFNFLQQLVSEIQEQQCHVHSIRMDTHEDNQPMQHLFHKMAFTKVGEMSDVYGVNNQSYVYEKLVKLPVIE